MGRRDIAVKEGSMGLRGARRAARMIGVGGLLIWLAVPLGVAAQTCELEVTPTAARGGSEFTLSGSGYSPAELTLQKDDGEPVTIPLALGGADPFSIPVASEPGDEGRWTATVTDPVADCSASVRFRVTLLDTAAAAAPGQPGPGSGSAVDPALLLVVYCLVIAAGFGGGLVLARYARTG